MPPPRVRVNQVRVCALIYPARSAGVRVGFRSVNGAQVLPCPLRFPSVSRFRCCVGVVRLCPLWGVGETQAEGQGLGVGMG